MGRKCVFPWVDELFCFVFLGASMDDYFRYEFYRKSWTERGKFITYLRSQRIIRRYNTPDSAAVAMLNNKSKTNLYFKDFIKRDWLDLDQCSLEMLQEFVEKHDRIIIKPKGGSGGKGIYTIDAKNISENAEFLDSVRGCIAEEILVQHKMLAKLNPSSVNTLRVMTFDGEMISCVLKIGSGNSVVDNMCSKGMYGNVNMNYGITDSLFFDIDLNRYAHHPYTGEKLLGIEIPHWNMLGGFIRQAAKMMPGIRYVGWDVAVLPDGLAIIEANETPGHDLSCQSTVQIGIYDKIKV